MANEIVGLKDFDIKTRIFTIRGQQVMLDQGLAVLYRVETRALNQAVKRNNERFPEEFMFQLTKEEFELLRSQFVISNFRSQSVTSNLKSQFATSKWKSQFAISNWKSQSVTSNIEGNILLQKK